jgi:hypothetical protein
MQTANQNGWLDVLQFSPYADWFAFRNCSRTCKLLSTQTQKMCPWQRPKDWLSLLLSQRGFDGQTCIGLLKREGHFLAGSFVLWGLLWPSGWLPGDVDFFGLTGWQKDAKVWNKFDRGHPNFTRQEDGHLTPFIHDLFNFERKFYMDEEFDALPKEQRPRDRLDEKLTCLKQKDGYELFPIISRCYKTGADAPVFDYTLIKSGLGPETLSWFRPLPKGIAQMILDYLGRPSGYTSVPKFFEAAGDALFCFALFDGQHLHVKDWNAIWTRSSKVDVDTCILPNPTWEKKQTFLVRTIHRVSKYRDRGFTIELTGDTSCLFKFDTCFQTCIKRRHSLKKGQRPVFSREPAIIYRSDGLLSEDPNWSLRQRGPWRPTFRLQRLANQQFEKHPLMRRRHWNVLFGRTGRRKSSEVRSQPSSPRAKAAVTMDEDLVRHHDNF